ncbi:MAG: hypothetical protein AAFX46_01345 [Cyanobacteria bacterium J06636_27]
MRFASLNIKLLIKAMSKSSSVRLSGENLKSIPINQENLFPEAVEYIPNQQKFLLTSLTEGTINALDEQGNLTPFAEDERLVSTIGIEIDEKQNRVLATNSDLGVSDSTSPETQNNLAALGIFDLTTGETIDYVDLGGLRPGEPHLANDVAVDNFGNAYVTDSLSPIIYKVDTEGNPSVFLENEQFAGEGFNLNGIAAHQDFLLVADSNDGEIFKVPLDNPEEFTQVEIDRELLNADGLLLADEDELVVVTNDGSEESSNSVFVLESDDNWESAQITDELAIEGEFTTAATTKDEQLLVLDAGLDNLFSNQLPFDDFRILEVGSIDNRNSFNLQDFANDLNLEQTLNNLDLLSNVEDTDMFADLFSINFGASSDSENSQDIIDGINKSLSEVKSFIIEESDNIIS